MEEAQKHLACLLQSGIHAFKSQQKMYGHLKCPFLHNYLFHEFSKINFLPTLFLQDSLQIKISFAARDCQNLIASYSPYMGDSYRILCHSRKSPGSQQCLGSWNITWNQSVLKYQAQLLIYKKIVASNPLSEFEDELHPNRTIQVLEQFYHCPLWIVSLKLKMANQSSHKAPCPPAWPLSLTSVSDYSLERSPCI